MRLLPRSSTRRRPRESSSTSCTGQPNCPARCPPGPRRTAAAHPAEAVYPVLAVAVRDVDLPSAVATARAGSLKGSPGAPASPAVPQAPRRSPPRVYRKTWCSSRSVSRARAPRRRTGGAGGADPDPVGVREGTFPPRPLQAPLLVVDQHRTPACAGRRRRCRRRPRRRRRRAPAPGGTHCAPAFGHLVRPPACPTVPATGGLLSCTRPYARPAPVPAYASLRGT